MTKFLDKYGWTLAILLSLPSAFALFVPGFYGASDEVHIAWLYEMYKTLQVGQIPPRFVPDLSYGFGYPLFNFVFPLPYYIGSVFHFLGLSLVDSTKAVFFLSIPLAAVFMYFFLRNLTGSKLSLLGAVLYSFAPYRSVDIYVRGAIGEIFAFVFFPVIALSVLKLTRETKKLNFKWIGIGALSIGGLILTHNIAAYMFIPFAAFLAIINWVQNKFDKQILLQLFLTFVLGILVAGYFWVPAILDSGLMKYDTVFNFIDHFPTLQQLYKPYWGYGASVPGPYDGMSFFLGISSIVTLLAAVVLCIFFFRKYTGEQKMILSWTFISLLIVIFMMNFRSTFLWQHLPLLPYFQFPWRFLMMTTFLIPILVITLEKVKYNGLIVVFLILLTLGINYSYFRPQDFLGRTDGYFLNKYIPVPKASDVYKMQQEEYLRLPASTITRPDKNYPLFYNQAGEAIAGGKQLSSLDGQLKSSFNSETEVNFSKYYFPGWKAEVDGKPVSITPGYPFGQITVKIPAGSHQTSILFSETTPKLFLDLVSVLCLSLSVFLALKGRFKKYED